MPYEVTIFSLFEYMLQNTEITSRAQLLDILKMLHQLRYEGKISFVHGSLAPDGNSMYRCRFRIRATGEVWELYAADTHHGKGWLQRSP